MMAYAILDSQVFALTCMAVAALLVLISTANACELYVATCGTQYS